jgi:hypothetical protein
VADEGCTWRGDEWLQLRQSSQEKSKDRRSKRCIHNWLSCRRTYNNNNNNNTNNTNNLEPTLTLRKRQPAASSKRQAGDDSLLALCFVGDLALLS